MAELNWLDEALAREATPKALRQLTIEQFAEKWGITSSKYNYEMGKDENWKKVLEITLNLAKKSTPEVLERLKEKAESGDLKAIEMFLDYILKLAKNLDIKSDGKAIPIYAGLSISGYKSDPEDISTEKED